MTQEIRVHTGSGNVFADLGLENSDELLMKAELARKISSKLIGILWWNCSIIGFGREETGERKTTCGKLGFLKNKIDPCGRL